MVSFKGSSVIHKVDGRITLTVGSLLDNLHWHYVTIKRYGRQVNFTVDSQTVTAVCNGDFTHLDLDTQASDLCMVTNSDLLFFFFSDGEYSVFYSSLTVVHWRGHRAKLAPPAHHTQLPGLPGKRLHQRH